MPKSMAVTSDKSAVNPATRRSGALEMARDSWSPGITLTSNAPSQAESSKPVPPPRSASIMLSVSVWRTRRARPAPSARRIAISFCRPVARASSRLATFAHAMRSTRPTIAINT